MKDAIFLLLRLGLGTSSPEKEDLSLLSALNEEQWEKIEDESYKHGVAAIVFDGISAVVEYKGSQFLNHFDDRSFWSCLIANWVVGTVEQEYVWGNEQQYAVIHEIQKRWADARIRMMLMKGQAMGTYYPVPKHRCPGDIDCYLMGDYTKGNDVARSFPADVNEEWYKHSQIQYCDELIENHQYFVHTREGKSSKELNQCLLDSLKDVAFDCLPGTQVLLPPPMFNAIFLTYHSLAHFLEEGLRLKQLLDWAMFLKRDQDKIDWVAFYKICDKFHFRRFVDVATDVAVHDLGVKIHNDVITTTSPYTQRVLQSTFEDDGYVFAVNIGKWGKRWLILKNLIKHRWKYDQIYQHSIWRQLWYYVIGFFFKTEYI